MKRDGHDPAMQSACLCVGRRRFAKASILLLKKASVSFNNRTKEACRPEDFVFDPDRLYVKLDVSRGKHIYHVFFQFIC